MDGGYYDNYGVVSLVDWLEDGLSDLALQTLPERVLILRLRSFADYVGDPQLAQKGWFYQVYAPVAGLYDVRDAAQKRNADRFLAAVRTRWAQAGKAGEAGCAVRSAVAIDVVDLVYPGFPDSRKECNQPPLSWRLNPVQQSCIPGGWLRLANDTKKGRCLQAIDAFVGKGAAIPKECDAFGGQG